MTNERDSGRSRPVIVVIGPGSCQYSVQSLWDAARLHLLILIAIMRNQEYAILNFFAVLEQPPGVPGLDIPGLDLASIARGDGCEVARLNELEAIKQAAAKALAKDVPTVLEVAISPQLPPLS